MKAQGGHTGTAVPYFLTLVLDGGGWSTPCPGRLTPRRELVPIVQEAVWAPGPAWMCVKNPPPPEFDSWTTQQVVCHYICYTIPAWYYLLFIVTTC